MGQRWYQKATVQAALVGGVFLVLVAIVPIVLKSGHQDRTVSGATVGQLVMWGPDAGMKPGILIKSPERSFVAWEDLEAEVRSRLLNRVDQIPVANTVRVTDFQGKPNMIVEVLDPAGSVIANVWFGGNPCTGFDWDGFIRIGTPQEPVVVWETFQRHADGSYIKVAEQN